MIKKATLALAFCLSFGFSAVNYPYPQAKSYGNSTINVTTANASTNLKSKFTSFLNSHYEESGNYARIKWDETDKTVSEGVAYGMLMMVYFSDATTSYQSHFDKLWAYYQKNVNERGLMRWKIQGFGNYIEENAASDAEFDAAVALVMAHYQFGSTSSKNYLDTAGKLIAKIRQHEISPNNLHKPGDVWDVSRNPSYISPAAFEIFKEVEPCQTAKDKWGLVVTANYKLLKDNQNKRSDKLFSDWCRDDGTPSNNTGATGTSSDYGYDAARVPWRVAWANAWYGHADAKTLLSAINTSYLNSKDANAISPGNSTYLGPFTNSLSVATDQTKLNNYWTRLIGFSGEGYYSGALQIITGLLATGNMPNLRKLANSTTTAGECSASGSQIDQFADAQGDNKSYARTWEPWYAFTDGESGGTSTLQNTRTQKEVWDKETKACKNENAYNIIMKDGSDDVAKIDRYSLSQGENEWHPFVAIGLDAEYNGSKYNFTGCTGGFSYKYKGSAHNFRVQLKTVTDFGYHYMEIPTTTTAWTEVVVQEPTQEAWATKVTYKLSDIDAFAWEVKGNGTCKSKDCKSGDPITGISPQTGSLAIKDFTCVGTMTFPAYYAPKCGEGSEPSSGSTKSSSSAGGGTSSSSSVSGGSSSSSRPSSSSTGGSGTSSSSLRSSSSAGGTSSSSLRSSSSAGGGGTSSTGEGNDNSSSSGDVSPIVLSQTVLSNGLNAMQNAVNLQAAGKATVQIFDLKGNAVRTLGFAQGSYVVQMADLPKGLYLVKASSGGWKQTVTVPVK